MAEEYGESLYDIPGGWSSDMDKFCGQVMTCKLRERGRELFHDWAPGRHADGRLDIGTIDSGNYCVTSAMIEESLEELRAQAGPNEEAGKDTAVTEVKQPEASEYDFKDDLNATFHAIGLNTYHIAHYLDEATERLREGKEHLIAPLGLNPVTMRRKFLAALPEGSRDHIPHHVALWLRNLEARHDFIFTPSPVAQCSKGGKTFKATRFLKKLIETENEIIPSETLIDAKAVNKEGDYLTSIFWSKLGEILGSPSLEMYVSVNPCDILTASHEGGFSSCLRPGGEYFATVGSWAHDQFSALCFIGSPKRKHGRAFTYFPDKSYHTFLFGNSYGSFPSFMRTIGRQAIETQLASYLGVDNIWHLGQPNLVSASYGGGKVYFDGADVDYMRTVEHKDTEATRPDIVNPVCILCDDERVDHRESITCPDHGGKRTIRCERCSDELNENYACYNDDGDAYCNCCFDELYFVCEHCDCTHDRDERWLVRDSHGNRYRVCGPCRDEYYTYCDRCAEWRSADGFVECADGDHDSVCARCHNRYYNTCDSCDKSTEEYTNVDHQCLCQGCLEDSHQECSECNKWVSNDDIEDDMCEDCYDEHHTDCEDCGDSHRTENLQDNNLCNACVIARYEEAV
jgi:hypothetical protein